MDQDPLPEDAASRAERRKKDPIGQILDVLSNSKKNKSSEGRSIVSSASGDPSSQDPRHFICENSTEKCLTKYSAQGSIIVNDSSAFKPFCKNIEEVTGGISNVQNQCFSQKRFPYINKQCSDWQVSTSHNVQIPITATSLYGLPGFQIQYPLLPSTVPHNAFPKLAYAFPHNFGYCPNLDISGNSMFSWMDKKISAESSFNPSCILNADDTRTHPTQAPPRYQCDSCKKSYSTYGGLSKHKQFHCVNQVKKEFSCKFCGKCYGSLGALKMHIRTHTLPCKCKICGKAFSRPWLLQGHIRTHTGEKPFRCDHCSRAFADRSNLRAHLQTHSEVKKYGCKNCSKTFSRMSLLVKHKENHCYR